MQQPEVMHQQGYIQNYNPNVYGSSPSYHPQQFQQIYRPQQSGYQPTTPQVYVLQQGTNPYQSVQIQPQQLQQNAQQNIPQQHQQHQQQRTVYQPMQPQQTHHTVQQAQSHQPQESVPKKKSVPIKIVDPNSGKDLTSEIQNRKKTEKQTATPRVSNQVKITPPVASTPQSSADSDEKLKQNKANAEFAAKVAAQVAAR